MKITDQFIIINKLTLASNDLDSLMMLYLPSTNMRAISVYLLLVSLSMHHEQGGIRKLCDVLNVDVQTLADGLSKCEQLQLISTYKKQEEFHDVYAFDVHRPLDVNSFLKHDVFGRYIIKVLDASYIMQLKEAHQSFVLDGFKNVSEAFGGHLLSDWEKDRELQFVDHNNHKKELPQSLSFDMRGFLQTTPDLLFPKAARTEANLETINYLGSLYAIDVVTMRKFVGKSTRFQEGTLDIQKLERLISGYIDQHKTATKSQYDQDSYLFFSAQQQGKPLGVRDKKTIAFLYEHYDFEQVVQNQLIEFVLQRFKGSFTKALLEQIADSWVRANIRSQADVKKHLSYTSPKATVVETPAYMESPAPQQKEDEKQRLALLKKLKKGDK